MTLNKTKDLVKSVLESKPATRNSDDVLYIEVCKTINPLYVDLPFWKILQSRKSYGFPPYESVRRARQKLQSDYPELAANENVEAQRAINEDKYRAFAKEVV